MSIDPPPHPVRSEVRFAAVMYGGISLCVYMNGITEQLYRLVRATARKDAGFGDGSGELLYEDKDLTPIELVYRRLAEVYSNPETGSGPITCRFVVDVLSGTSAGGLNSLFLARALANHEPLDPLTKLWIREGDISALLNDRRSLRKSRGGAGAAVPPEDPPQSLLNSNRMAQRLLEAQRDMEKGARSGELGPDRKSRLARHVDLYMTATDLQGLDLPLGVSSDERISERRHRAVFHFVYDQDDAGFLPNSNLRNDFDPRITPFLTFVGRATSSIVGAFEPICLSDIGGLKDPGTDSATHYDPGKVDERFSQFYRDYWSNSKLLAEKPDDRGNEIDKARKAFPNRPFGDGGYGDNYPFGYAIDEIQRRRDDVRVERKFLYLEPDPDLDAIAAYEKPESRPNVLGHIGAAASVKTTETIRDDIQRIRDRNALLERISGVREAIEVGAFPKAPSGASDAYARLRATSTTDDLTDTFARLFGFEAETIYWEALRAIVKAIRVHMYSGNETSGFLEAFDIGTARRQVTYILGVLSDEAAQAQFGTSISKLRNLDRRLVRLPAKLQLVVRHHQGQSGLDQNSYDKHLKKQFDGNAAPCLNQIGQALDDLVKALERYNADLLDKLAQILLKNPIRQAKGKAAYLDADRVKAAWRLLSIGDEPLPELTAFLDVLQCVYKQELSNARAIIGEVETAIHGSSFAQRCRNFEQRDRFMLPILYGSGSAESDCIDVLRVSPLDCDTLVEDPDAKKHKLAGTSAGHFGGFFKHAWRAEDVLWGRLDGAERLICSVLDSDNPHRPLLILQAQAAILAQTDLDSILSGILSDNGEKLPEKSQVRALRAMLLCRALDYFGRQVNASRQLGPILQRIDKPASQAISDAGDQTPYAALLQFACDPFSKSENGEAEELNKLIVNPPEYQRATLSDAESLALVGRSLNISGKVLGAIKDKANAKTPFIAKVGARSASFAAFVADCCMPIAAILDWRKSRKPPRTNR